MNSRTSCRALIAVAVLSWSSAALAQQKFCGRASVVDGDDLVVAGKAARLWGIDAFEPGQSCTRRNGDKWPCGDAATRELERLIGDEGVCCERMQSSRSRDRLVMRCQIGDKDLGMEMVRRGLALDCPRFSKERYKATEAEAKAAGQGAWEGTFKAPWLQKGKVYCCSAEHPREFCP